MIPVYQTLFEGRPGPGAGNCDQACIASLLELPLESVPNFAEVVDDHERLTAKAAWLAEKGYWLLGVEESEGAFADAGFHVIVGKSPRGDWLHAVIGYGAEVVHDPNPDGGGVEGVVGREFLIPISPKVLS